MPLLSRLVLLLSQFWW